MRRNLFSLSQGQGARIEPYLPMEVRGNDQVENWRVISAACICSQSVCRWCHGPLPEYGPPTTIYNRFVRAGRSAAFGSGYSVTSGAWRFSGTQG